MRTSGAGKILWISIIILAFFFSCTVLAEPGQNTVTITVKDARTKMTVADSRIYLDGGYRGTIPASSTASSSHDGGQLVIPYIKPGNHTVRVTSPGFREKTIRFSYPGETEIEVMMDKSGLVSLNTAGASPNGISIVFYPSSTSYNCTGRVKVSTPVYLENETRFREDVMRILSNTYQNLGSDTSPDNPLPENFAEKFNFYYYFDPSLPADAFDGCTGTVPEMYWDTVTSADITIILYPNYYGTYSDPACQPHGCSKDSGPGHTLMKVPSNRPLLIKHESGHAVFGLVDTYCGETYYYENRPYANVWASDDSCRNAAAANSRDPGQCRRIKKTASPAGSCSKNFWQWDPAPDIMSGNTGGKFGTAATQRIVHVLSRLGSGQQ